MSLPTTATPTIATVSGLIRGAIVAAMIEYRPEQLLQLAVAMRRMDLQEQGAHPHDSVGWGYELEELRGILEQLDRDEQIEQCARGELARLSLAASTLEHLSEWIAVAEEMSPEVGHG